MLAIAAVAHSGVAHAHRPATSTGPAVAAFGEVSVSHEPGSVVSDVEAGGFPTIVGSNVKVAFMASTTDEEIAGGPPTIAEEIACEAGLDGSAVVLVGTQLVAWSDDVDADRLAVLVRGAARGGSPASAVESLVRSIQAEPRDTTPPWGWIAAVSLLFAVAALVVLGRVRRRP